jgi:Xaa-Pro dipeptidase
MNIIQFGEAEFLGRIKKCQALLEERNMNGMVVSAEANINYYTGYRTHAPWTTFTRPMFLFIPKEGKPLLYTQTFVTPEATIKSFGCDNRNFDSLLGPTAAEIAGIMEEKRMHTGRIGFELGFEQRINFQVDTFLSLSALLRDAEFVDASSIIWEQRLIKSPSEIECHRIACEATGYAHDRTFEEIEEGMSEREISMLAQKYMLDGGAEYPGFVIITSGEGNYERISAISSERRIRKGDMVWLDLGARYNGYWSDYCRAGYVGKPTDYQNKRQDDIYDVTEEAASIMRPGVAISDVAYACGKALEKRGYEATYDCGRMGHGMGLMSTEPPSVTVRDKGILKAGMIINLEPGLLEKDGVFCIEENYVITEDGCERLSTGSRKLHSIRCS